MRKFAVFLYGIGNEEGLPFEWPREAYEVTDGYSSVPREGYIEVSQPFYAHHSELLRPETKKSKYYEVLGKSTREELASIDLVFSRKLEWGFTFGGSRLPLFFEARANLFDMNSSRYGLVYPLKWPTLEKGVFKEVRSPQELHSLFIDTFAVYRGLLRENEEARDKVRK